MGERVKGVYVMWEICEKEVYVMRDMKKCLCDGREGVPITNLPPPKRVFSPTPPFAGKPETSFYIKPTNSLIINHLFKLLIINVLL
jgi:hypothetical protein